MILTKTWHSFVESNAEDSSSGIPITLSTSSMIMAHGIPRSSEMLESRDMVEMDEDVNLILSLLTRESHRGVVVLGDRGSGKSVILKAVSARLQHQRVPNLSGKSCLVVDPRVVLSKDYSQFSSEVEAADVVVIDDFLVLERTANLQTKSLLSAVLPVVLSKKTILLLSAELDQFEAAKRTAVGPLLSVLDEVKLDVPDEKKASILTSVIGSLSLYHGVHIPEGLAKFVISKTGSVGDAVDLLDRGASSTKMRSKQELEKHTLEQASAGIITTGYETDVRKIRGTICKKVVGQNHVIDEVLGTLTVTISGMKRPDRTMGAFIFYGPSGTGKTLMARSLAESVLLNLKGMIVLNMSEFSMRHLSTRLIGASPGFVGYEKGGQLTNHVDAHPNSVILLDEIEKADSTVFDLLLQILDSGNLTDATGKTVDFSQTIVVMTTNLGSRRKVTGSLGFSDREPDKEIGESGMSAIRKFFRPELLNRIDGIIQFKSMSTNDIALALKLHVEEIQELIKDTQVRADIRDTALRAVAERRNADKFPNMRPAIRDFDREIRLPISKAVAEGKKKRLIFTGKKDKVVIGE